MPSKDQSTNANKDESGYLDIHVLGHIIAAQNRISDLPDAGEMAELCSQMLSLVPGVSACCVCLSNVPMPVGGLNSLVCKGCKAKWESAGATGPPGEDFACELAGMPGNRSVILESAGQKLGFFVFQPDHTGVFEPYLPLINSLGNFLVLTLENRLQRNKLEEMYSLYENRLEEKTSVLKESEAQYIDLYENAPDMSASVNAKTSLIERCNNTLARMLGYSKEEIIGKSIFEIYHPDCLEEVKKVFEAFVKTGDVRDKELQLRRKDGSKLDISLNVSSLRDEAGNILFSRSTLRDITRRKRGQEALRKSEAELREAQHVGRLGSWEWDALTDTITWSEEYYRIYGFDPTLPPPGYEEHLKAYTPESAARLDAAVKRNLETGEPYEIDLELVKTDGSTRWITARSETRRDANGQIIGLCGTAQDITERKLTENTLHQLNRELRAISNCNQTLLRAEDEQTLLNEICHIICDEAGYRLAWVGYADNDDEKTVRPIAWAGFEDGYLTGIHITWADNERGHGPTGTAIRSGKIIYIQDFTNDPQFAPWLESALRRGYRSSIALPLRDEYTNVFGVLNIYSVEPNAFTLNEERLLEELAGDLAFGISTLRTRVEHKRAEEALRISEERFSKVFQLSPVSICIFQVTDGSIVAVNDTFVNETGYPRDELTGHTLGELQLFADPAERDTILQILYEKGSVSNFEFKTRHKSGKIGVGLNTTIEIDLGRERHFLSLIQDITVRKQTEKELIEAKERAVESDRLKTAFLCNMSHENPHSHERYHWFCRVPART
jgi:PAS domain S-box-containing protein